MSSKLETKVLAVLETRLGELGCCYMSTSLFLHLVALLFRFQVFVLKFKTIAKSHLPNIIAKCKAASAENKDDKPTRPNSPSPGVDGKYRGMKIVFVIYILPNHCNPKPSFHSAKDSETEASSSTENLKTEDSLSSQDGASTSSSSKPSAAQLLLEKELASEEKQKALQVGGRVGDRVSCSVSCIMLNKRARRELPLCVKLRKPLSNTEPNHLNYSHINAQATQMTAYSVTDCRSLVKTLVCGVKTITWGIASCRSTDINQAQVLQKQFQPKETGVFVRLVKYALQALDIYTVNLRFVPN